MSLVFLAVAAITLLPAPACFAVSWGASAFRAESGYVVRRGMSKPEILQRAGQPFDRQPLAPSLMTGPIGGTPREQWFYRGEDGTYVVTFTGSRSVAIDVIPDR